VLSYLRRAGAGEAVLVALNLSAKPQTVSFNLEPQGVYAGHASTLLSSFGKAGQSANLNRVVLPAYGSWVAQIR
jgi:alpha-glucosidase